MLRYAVYTHTYGMLEFLALLLGYGYIPNSPLIEGVCRRATDSVDVPCVMQKQPFGMRYVTDYQAIYTVRPVFFGGHSEIRYNNRPLSHDLCIMRGDDIYCDNTITFISGREPVKKSPYIFVKQ